MYRYNMTSIFEVSPYKEILQTERMTQKTGQKMNQDPAALTKNKNEDEPISRRYFLICQTCFWCASYIDMMGNIEDSSYKACPTCNNTEIESLPILNNEHYHFQYTPTRGVVLEFLR